MKLFAVISASLGLTVGGPLAASSTSSVTVAPSSTPSSAPEPVRYPWQQKLPLAPNYAQFVSEARPAALAGSADAQFAMHVAFSFCRDGLKKRSAEEARHFPEAVMQDMHKRCDALASQYPDLAGEADHWLTLALNAKFPRALAFAARYEIESLRREKVTGDERTKRLDVARTRLILALNANDPGVTFEAAGSMHAFFPGDPRVKVAVSVWVLAACVQGLECGVGAAWMHDSCRMELDCRSGETGFQYIHRFAGDFPSLDERARKLALMLRNSQLGEKEFAETLTSLPMPPTSTGAPH